MSNLDEFVRGYVTCMLWLENDESDDKGGEPLDHNYGPKDIHPDSMRLIREDCAKFLEQPEDMISEKNRVGTINPDEGTLYDYAGHDFYLTRHGHDCGFWDGDWTKEVGERLTELAKSFRECYVSVGDDGMIYVG